MKMPRAPGCIALLASSLSLGGCGFHLAGEQKLVEPLQSVYIEFVDPYHVTVPPLEAALQARIVRSGGEVKPKIGQAKSVLRLSNLSETQELLSVGPDGNAIEYRLVTRVTYELRSGTKELIPPQSQGLDRAFSFSAAQILPKEAEETRLSAYIQDELAEVILLRIQAQLKHSPEGVPAPPPPAPNRPSPPAADAPATDVAPVSTSDPVNPADAPAVPADATPGP